MATAAETKKKRTEITRYAQKTDIGILDKETQDQIIEEAVEMEEWKEFIDKKAVEATEAVEKRERERDKTASDVKCPQSPRHKNIRRYAVAPRGRRCYVCDDCGRTWQE